MLQVVESNRPFTRNFGTFTFWNEKEEVRVEKERVDVHVLSMNSFAKRAY